MSLSCYKYILSIAQLVKGGKRLAKGWQRVDCIVLARVWQRVGREGLVTPCQPLANPLPTLTYCAVDNILQHLFFIFAFFQQQLHFLPLGFSKLAKAAIARPQGQGAVLLHMHPSHSQTYLHTQTLYIHTHTAPPTLFPFGICKSLM